MFFRSSRLQRFFVIAILIAAIFTFYAGTIREGHIWGDDVAMYILHARNIAEMRPYADTGYIFNPDYATLGPVAYPPGYPLMLSPIWAAGGLDLDAMKMLGVVLFSIALAFLYVLYRRYLEWPECIALIAVVGLCPMLWGDKDSIGSDLAFLPFLFGSLLLIDRAYTNSGQSQSGQPRLGRAISVGLLIAAAYSVRTAGAVLLPSLIVFDWSRTRRLSAFAIAACATALAAGLVENALVRTIGATPSLFRLDPHLAATNARLYYLEFRAFWSAGGLTVLSRLLVWTVILATGWLLKDRLRSGKPLRVAEIFLFFYLGMLLIYQPNQIRFLFPAFPIFAALAIEGLSLLVRRLPNPYNFAAALLLLVAWGLGIAAQYSVMDRGPIREGFLDDDFLALTAFIKSQTRESDILLFRKPRWLPLLTGRRAVTYAHTDGLGGFIKGLHVNYFIAANSPAGVFASDAEFLWPYIESHSGDLVRVYRNSSFSMYRAISP